MIYADGTIYQGKFSNNKPDGLGITIITKYHELAKKNEQFKHKGFYRAGKPQGKGVQVWENGTIFKGHFEKGQMSSQNAILKYSDGTEYKGDVVDGLLHGKGTLKFSNNSKYVGGFKKSKMDDKNGKLIILEDNGSTAEIYKGGFKNGNRHGSGTLSIPGSPKETVRYKNGKLVTKPKNNKTG